MAQLIKIAPFPPPFKRAYAAIVDAPEHAADEPLPTDHKLWRAVIESLHNHGDGNCGICGTPVDLTLSHGHPAYGTLDHVKPTRLGGHDSWSNVQIAHSNCNIEKNMFTEDYPIGAEAAARLATAVAAYLKPTAETVQSKIDTRMFYFESAEQKAVYLRGVVAELSAKAPNDPGKARLHLELAEAERTSSRELVKLKGLQQELAQLEQV